MNWKNIDKAVSQFTDEELLVKAKQGDTEAKEQLFKQCIPLVKMIVNKWHRRGLYETFDELMSIGCFGLIKAYDKYKFETGKPFRNYAGTCIKYELCSAYRYNNAKKRTIYGTISFDYQVTKDNAVSDDDDITFYEEVPNGEKTPYEDIERTMLRLAQKEFELVATQREREIMQKHYNEDKTFDEIGMEYGLTRQRIQQIHKKAVNKLKQVVAM